LLALGLARLGGLLSSLGLSLSLLLGGLFNIDVAGRKAALGRALFLVTRLVRIHGRKMLLDFPVKIIARIAHHFAQVHHLFLLLWGGIHPDHLLLLLLLRHRFLQCLTLLSFGLDFNHFVKAAFFVQVR
jgi:hypothetical protein